MKLNTYVLTQYGINILRLILGPFVLLLSSIIPILNERRAFERKNPSTSYLKSKQKSADACFHVSSEGELQQCLVIIQEYLSQNKIVELVYTSPSVEKKCLDLDRENQRLFSYRLPLVLFPFYSFTKWVSAKKLFMCRYDFYSDLMLYGARKDVEFILLSASLKGKEDKLGKFMKSKFELFDSIYAASDKDMQLFKSLNISSSIYSFEFRLLQIAERIEKHVESFEKRDELHHLYQYVKSRDISSNIILGSAWKNEMQIFVNTTFQEKIINSTYFVCIAPHELSSFSIDGFIKEIKSINSKLDVQVLSVGEEIRKGAIVINPFRGILLESFSFFGHSYIGGGHTRSIHSVLEPFLSNSMVYCGPKTHRSTEYDFILSYNEQAIKVIDLCEDFFDNLSNLNLDEQRTKRKELVDTYKATYKTIMENIVC
jgi:3-deoxy-D-manno-octulosonic-acid transferase